MKSAVILGGGLSGLVVADRLQEKGFQVIVVEKDPSCGGMCQSKVWTTNDGHRVLYDLGPHKFAPCSDVAKDYFLRYVRNPIEVPITGAVYLGGKILSYPVKVTEILKNFPLKGIRCGVDFMLKFLNSEDGTYGGYIRRRLGTYTYNFVFRDYANKIWGDPDGLDWELARTRFVTPKLSDMIIGALTGKNTLTFKSFMYPNICMGVFARAIELKIKENGGKILLNSNASSYDGKRLRLNVMGKEVTIDDPLIVSTIEPRELASVMALDSKPLSALKYRSINMFYFLIKGERPNNTWLFYPEKSIKFNRTSVNFHPKAAGDGKFLVCVEVTGSKKDISNFTRSDLERCLCDIYSISKTDIVDQWNYFLRNAYPVYHVGFKEDIKTVLRMLESHGRVFCIGRHACHNYNNMDHTIIEALDLAEIVGDGGDVIEWGKKRESYDWRIID